MIDHIVGTPSPSWKRTQVRSLQRYPPSLILPLGLSRHFRLAMEDHLG